MIGLAMSNSDRFKLACDLFLVFGFTTLRKGRWSHPNIKIIIQKLYIKLELIVATRHGILLKPLFFSFLGPRPSTPESPPPFIFLCDKIHTWNICTITPGSILSEVFGNYRQIWNLHYLNVTTGDPKLWSRIIREI